MKPHPKVSPKHYDPPTAAAKVKFRLKGRADGDIYQGQKIIVPCRTCPK